MARNCAAEGRLDKASAEQALDFFLDLRRPLPSRQRGNPPLPGNGGQGLPPPGWSDGRDALRARARPGPRPGQSDAFEGAAAGQTEAVGRFVAHARGYVGLLREHIEKEDHCLFAMAHRALTEDDQRR